MASEVWIGSTIAFGLLFFIMLVFLIPIVYQLNFIKDEIFTCFDYKKFINEFQMGYESYYNRCTL